MRWCALLALSACSSPRAITVALPPADPSVQTVLIAYLTEGEPFLEAHPRTDELVLRRDGTFDEIEIVYYAETLETLGLPEGEVPRAAPGTCLTSELPTSFVSAFRVSIDAGVSVATRVPGPGRCWPIRSNSTARSRPSREDARPVSTRG